MLTGKRLKALIATGILIAGTSVATGANAQSNAEMMRVIQQLQQKVESLENKVQNNAINATAAKDQAKAAHDAAKSSDGGGMKYKWGPSMTFKSTDGKFEMHVRGRIMVDFGHVNDNIGVQDRFATEFRRVRLGVEGKAWKDVKYKFEIDFADNEVSITDAYVQFRAWKPVKITVGQFKEFGSIDETTSSRQISVNERAAFTDAFDIARRIGVGFEAGFDDFGVELGLYGGGDISSNDDNEGYAFAGRLFWNPEIGNGGRLHVGGFVRYRDLSNDQDDAEVRYRQRPVAHVSGTRYVSTGTMPYISSDTMFGAELAGTFGSFWVATEYAFQNANVENGMESYYNGQSSLNFSGGYFDVGWFITGESRPLKGGKFDRPKVNNPVFEGGAGAWAVVARVDYLDLNDFTAGVNGGEQLSYIIGVNWYLNRHTRVVLNYAHTDVSKGICSAGFTCVEGDAEVNPITGKAKIDAVMGRFQVDW